MEIMRDCMEAGTPFSGERLLDSEGDPELRAGTVIVLDAAGLPVVAPNFMKSWVHPRDKYVGSTRQTITLQIEEFARELTGAADLHYVEVRPLPCSKPQRCYGNCDLACQVLGGEMVLGYAIWSTNDLFLSAEHHCVVQLPNDRCVDPTPELTGAARVLFARSGQPATREVIESVVLTGMSGKYKAVVNHPFIHEALRVLDEESRELQECRIEARRTGTSISPVAQRRWVTAVETMESLIDAYYRQQWRKKESGERRLRRKRRKAERRARKSNRKGAKAR